MLNEFLTVPRYRCMLLVQLVWAIVLRLGQVLMVLRSQIVGHSKRNMVTVMLQDWTATD